jgi:hypothetical protein
LEFQDNLLEQVHILAEHFNPESGGYYVCHSFTVPRNLPYCLVSSL